VARPVISFLLPEADAVLAGLPTSIGEYWDWQGRASMIFPYWGRYHWVVQTFLYLKQAGMPVTLTNNIPTRGIILTHMDCVEYGWRPTRDQYLVVMLVDREYPHPRANMHILHNPVQRLHLGSRHCYVPPWPQIGLLPRSSFRGDRFEVLGYFGYAHNLHPSIRDATLQSRIARLGLQMYVPPPAAWHDFSGVDCVMAIRNFGRSEAHLNKPSLKLLNAWLAGVPAILGHESAYLHDGLPSENYLEATTPDELINSLRRLRDSPTLRRTLAERGRDCAATFEAPQTVERWRRLIDEILLPGLEESLAGSFRVTTDRLLAPIRERVFWRKPGWFL
jgi:hypothetical protein